MNGKQIGDGMKVEIMQKNPITGEISKMTMPGESIGPFAIHMTPESSDREWTVTHVATGYAIQQFLPSKPRAAWLATKLAEIDVWGFTDPQAARAISKDDMAAITVLRTDAMNGDCQGEIDD